MLPSLNKLLVPEQCGLIKYGFDISIHTARLNSAAAAAMGHATADFDFQNAFNSLDKVFMIRILFAFFPDLAWITFSLYRFDSNLVLEDGTVMQSRQGARQGCSLATLIFSLAMWFIGQWAKKRNEERRQKGEATWTSQSFFFDDVRAVSYTHLRAHETRHDLVCRLLLEKKK